MAKQAPAKWGVGITTRNLQRQFGDLKVLKGLDLDIQAGESLVIIGRSGCGKSTLLRLLAGLDEPDGGKLDFVGESEGSRDHSVRMMYQEPRLLPWKTVVENVGIGSVEPVEAKFALHEVELDSKAQNWPASLSGGQKQRVALARALAHRPELLLLDEPLGALDALTRSTMHRLIESLWQEHGFTLVMVTHDVSEAVMLADRVIVLDDGAIGLDINIRLPRPRVATDPIFVGYEARLLEYLTGVPVEPADKSLPRHKWEAARPDSGYLAISN
jgi:sulfonate transport system ATP-binding protein